MIKVSRILTAANRRTPWEVMRQRIQAFYNEHGRVPSPRSKDPEEMYMGQSLSNQILRDPSVRIWRENLQPFRPLQSWETSFQEIKDFFEKHGRVPALDGDPEELRLCKILARMTNKSMSNYRPEVRDWRNAVQPIKHRVTGWQETFEEFKNYYNEHGVFPDSKGKLYSRFIRYVKPNSPERQEEAVEWVKQAREEILAKKLQAKARPQKQIPLYTPKVEYKREWAS